MSVKKTGHRAGIKSMVVLLVINSKATENVPKNKADLYPKKQSV
jgi:hypothetical protein